MPNGPGSEQEKSTEPNKKHVDNYYGNTIPLKVWVADSNAVRRAMGMPIPTTPSTDDDVEIRIVV